MNKSLKDVKDKLWSERGRDAAMGSVSGSDPGSTAPTTTGGNQGETEGQASTPDDQDASENSSEGQGWQRGSWSWWQSSYWHDGW